MKKLDNLIIKTYLTSNNNYRINIMKCKSTVYLKALLNDIEGIGSPTSFNIELSVEFRPKTTIRGNGMNNRVIPGATLINPCTAELTNTGIIQNVKGLYLTGSNVAMGHFEFVYDI